MESYDDVQKTIKIFFQKIEGTRAAIHASTDALNRASGLSEYLKISKSNLSPPSIANKLKTTSAGFLRIDFDRAKSFGIDGLDFLIIKNSITEDIQPKLDVAAYDWTSLFPPNAESYTLIDNMNEHPDDVTSAFTTLSEAYAFADKELLHTVLQNTAFLLSDMGIKIR